MRTPPPPGMTCGRFLINTVQSLDRHTKSALSFDMYSQQFTLCYFPVKSPLLRIRSQNFLRHRSVSGAPPPEKNPGSAPVNSFVFSKLYYCSSVWSNTSSSNIRKLQGVQNFAARIVSGTRKFDHVCISSPERPEMDTS